VHACLFREAGGELSRFVKELRALDPEGKLWHSIWANFRTGTGNAILSYHPKSWLKLHGQAYLTEKVRPYAMPPCRHHLL
jgi:hypothetical protein